MSDLDNTARLITALLIFVLVLALTYLVTRWVAGYQRGQMSKGNIEVIETFRLSQTKYIQIIKVGKKYLVIGICKDTMTMLTSIDETDLELPEGTGSKPESFQEVFQRVKEWKQKKEEE
ncbi:MAG: flagellar biosynthetic protein FliO [Lachnospiraceae bacterium]|nr:flagellar biosynthetic protein FliO [Lachnospiraceae bacterium]